MRTRLHLMNNDSVVYRTVCLGYLREPTFTEKRMWYETQDRQYMPFSSTRRLSQIIPRLAAIEVLTALEGEHLQYAHDLLQSVPFIQDIITPTEEGLRVDAINQPADKVIFACRLFNYIANLCGTCMMPAVMEAGLPPDIKSVAFLCLVDVFSQVIYNSVFCGTGTKFWPVPNYNDESGVFNFSTFGKESLHQFLNAGKDFSPWKQDTIQAQRGYSRNSDMRQRKEIFELFDGINHQRDDDYRRWRWDFNPYMSLNRLFSLPQEQTPLFNTIAKGIWSLEKVGGFAYDIHFNDGQKTTFETKREALLVAYEDLFSGN